MAEKLLLTPEEAFKSLSISRAKGFQMLASGELPSIRLGRLRRVPSDQLREWVASQGQKLLEAQEK